MSQTFDENLINVAIRLRPFVQRDKRHIKSVQILESNPPSLLIEEKDFIYTYDHIFPDSSTQDTVFEEIVQPHIEHVFAGQCCTVFAYGQTGTGKTYTMGMHPGIDTGGSSGMLQKTLEAIFLHKFDDNQQVTIHISFIEIYNEKPYDLLTNQKQVLQMRGFQLPDVKTVNVRSVDEALKLFTVGSVNRHIGETRMNSNSSRSHAIFTIHCSVTDENVRVQSKLHLVDLAGSESAKRTGNEGVQLEESISINKGLFYMGQVVKALANGKVPPYRESTLTKILHDSLTGSNYVTLVACISPCVDDVTETIATLDFAKKIKEIKNGFKGAQFESTTKITKSGGIKRTYNLTSGSVSKVRKALPFNNSGNTPLLRNVPFNSNRFVRTEQPSFGTDSCFGSSISTTINEYAAQNLSPIVKRCAEALQDTMLNQIETIVKRHLAETTKQAEAKRFDTPEYVKKLEPKISTLMKKMDRIVRANGTKLPVSSSPKTEPDDDEDVSSASHQLDLSNIEPVKTESSASASEARESEEIDQNTVQEFQFKAPLPVKSFKPEDVSLVGGNDVTESHAAPRRSVRLSIKMEQLKTESNYTKRVSSRIRNRISLEKSLNKSKQVATKPAKKKLTKAMKQHEEDVLHVLNKGTEKQLKTLATIGPKTAAQIMTYRKLTGDFKSIKNLQQLPGWKGYKKFVAANCLNL